MERLSLPNAVVGEIDIARLRRELNSLNDFFVSSRNRAAGTANQPPKLGRLLDQLAQDNKLNLLEEASRTKLLNALDQIQKTAPRLQISFAAEPAPKAFEQILAWLRQNIHPYTLVQIGLQPAIAAGCIVRTPNKVFDLSLRANLKQQESYLAKLITGAVNER